VWFKRWFDADVLRRVDIIVMSEEDIAEAPDLEPQIAEVAPCLILTRGDKGGTCYYNGTPIPYDAVKVDDKYLTGAGDVFAASLIATLFRLGGDIQAAVQVAARLAAYSTLREGLQSAPTMEEVQSTFELISQR
jgi:sugar/nucleoside kinase (ribokinase family)